MIASFWLRRIETEKRMRFSFLLFQKASALISIICMVERTKIIACQTFCILPLFSRRNLSISSRSWHKKNPLKIIEFVFIHFQNKHKTFSLAFLRLQFQFLNAKWRLNERSEGHVPIFNCRTLKCVARVSVSAEKKVNWNKMCVLHISNGKSVIMHNTIEWWTVDRRIKFRF